MAPEIPFDDENVSTGKKTQNIMNKKTSKNKIYIIQTFLEFHDEVKLESTLTKTVTSEELTANKGSKRRSSNIELNISWDVVKRDKIVKTTMYIQNLDKHDSIVENKWYVRVCKLHFTLYTS